MTGYLLDTNILSDLIHQPQGVVAKAIARVGETNISTSIIVACELRYGAAKKNSRVLTDRVALILSLIKIWPLEVSVAGIYAEIRSAIEQSGELIGPNDLLIAAHCLSMNSVLVTGNEREFSRVRDLRLENWLR